MTEFVTTTLDATVATGASDATGSARVAQVATPIAPHDEMYGYALQHLGKPALARMQYMRQGARISATFQRVAAHCFRGKPAPLVLDFASGHGRATRYLAQAFGPERVWASDIQLDAVDFCRAQFGVQGFASTRHAEDLRVEERFGLIVVCSLFSHLPRAAFGAWLKALGGLLEADGVLAFSVHGADMVPAAIFPAEGHLFVAESESAVLDAEQYGTAYVSEAFVRAEIARSFGAEAGIRLLRKGLCGAQDLYIVSRDPGRGVATLPELMEPEGYVDRCVLGANGQLRVTGWAVSLDPADPIDCIALELDGDCLAVCGAQLLRGDVAKVLGNPAFEACGFDVEIGLRRLGTAEHLLKVEAQTMSGARDQLLITTLSDLRAP